jgi:hypothetical protein
VGEEPHLSTQESLGLYKWFNLLCKIPSDAVLPTLIKIIQQVWPKNSSSKDKKFGPFVKITFVF